jgi:preprotein translocase SecE subunit
MAIAVQNSSEATTAPNPQSRLLIGSVIGAVYVAICLAVVAFGVPYLWKLGMSDWITRHLGSFVDVAGLIVVLVTVAAGLLFAGLAIAGPTQPLGLRAGVFTFLVGALGIFLITVWVGQLLERYLIKGQENRNVGLMITCAIAVGLIVAAVRYCFKPRFASFLVTFGAQGWFQTKTHKPSQGLLLRRLTIAGILILAGTGIWSLDQHRTLETATHNWTVHIPFTSTNYIREAKGPGLENVLVPDIASSRYVTLLPDVVYTVPLLLIGLSLWVSWRAVNYPVFADFLIATQAEMNKVSWTTRRRLVQDTIVVLVTVVLFTVFLLFVDQIWGWVLTRETLGGIVPKAKAVDRNANQDVQERPY